MSDFVQMLHLRLGQTLTNLDAVMLLWHIGLLGRPTGQSCTGGGQMGVCVCVRVCGGGYPKSNITLL